MALTKRQKEVLDFVSTFVHDHGYSPSYEELAAGLNLASIATVHKHVSSLEQKNYLRRSFNQSRSIELTSKYVQEQRRYQKPVLGEVPLLGRIAAGLPIESVAGRESLAFTDFTSNPDTYALQVRGDSMIEDHICDGDYVLVERTSSVRNGDIVVALIGGVETTLKRYYDEGERVRLQPANAAMEPIYTMKDQLEVQGRLLAVLRKYR